MIRKLVPQTGPYILTRPELNPSAKLLARALGLQKSYEPRNYAPVIRWGNSAGVFPNDTQHNRREIISIVSNKLRFSEAMKGIGILHVEIQCGMPERFPVVIRHNLSGSGGNGIEILNLQDFPHPQEMPQWFQNRYWSYWRQFSIEFGVHVFDGKIVKVFKKVSPEGKPAEQFPIRNMTRGYGFRVVDTSNYPKLPVAVEDFCAKFGMSFGRIDVGWDMVERKYVIIEANSAPGIAENENTLALYVNGFKKILGKE